jgi:hypothetical protein
MGVITPSCMLLCSTLGSHLILKDPLTRSRIAGTLAIMAGLVVMGWDGLANRGELTWLGDAMFVLGGVFWASYTIGSRVWRVDPLHATAYASGNTETCTFATPSAGTYHVKLNGYSAASGMSLKGAYSTGGGGGGNVLTSGVESAQYSGASASWTCYTLSVPAGKSSVVFNQVGKTGTTGDADLYVRYNAQPTTSSYNCRPYLSGSTESCTISSPAAGTWHACSRGYSAYTAVTMKGTY